MSGIINSLEPNFYSSIIRYRAWILLISLPTLCPRSPSLSHSLPLSLVQVRHVSSRDRKSKRTPVMTLTSKVKKTKMKSYASYKSRFRTMNDGKIRRWREGKLHNAYLKCLVVPWRAQYGGGIIVNPEFINLNSTECSGNRQIRQDMSNKFTAVHNRTKSISQKVSIQSEQNYTFSAWVQISKGTETVTALFNTSIGGLLTAGKVVAEQGPEELQVTYANKTAARGARISIKQLNSDFPLGCGMNYHILESMFYQDGFKSRFKYATFTNEMKWYTNEKNQDQENYTLADSMLNFTKQNGIFIRGHNILWDDPRYQPKWVKNLSPEELRNATEKRMTSIVTRYAGQVISWDVVNENLHFRFFEDNLSERASSEFYVAASKLDQEAIMFLNEYNTIELPSDQASGPENYSKKVRELLSYPGTRGIKLGIGLEGHFGASEPNLGYMRSTLDTLATLGLPIWLTEVDVKKNPNVSLWF